MTDETESADFNNFMSKMLAYAGIGQAAYIGMFISGILAVISLCIGGLSFSPLVGFFTVPLACIWLGLKGLKK